MTACDRLCWYNASIFPFGILWPPALSVKTIGPGRTLPHVVLL
jgi:hypothetical protein